MVEVREVHFIMMVHREATGNYFSGKMSDFALYNDALTKSDIEARYEATQLGKAQEFQQQVVDILSEVDSLIEDAGL